MPVKVVFSREDDMAAGIYRPAIKYRIAAAIKDGKITGYHLKEAAINSNMYGLIPNFFPAGAIENYQVDVAKYESNITTGAWRAPYTNFLAFAEQSFFDELAETLGVDNIQLRIDLLQNVKGTTDEKIQYSPDRLEGVIKLAVEKSNWGNAKEGVYQGFSSYYCHNTHVAEVADIVMETISGSKKSNLRGRLRHCSQPLRRIKPGKRRCYRRHRHAMYAIFPLIKACRAPIILMPTV